MHSIKIFVTEPEKYTVYRPVCAHFHLEILLAGAVKGLKMPNRVLKQVSVEDITQPVSKVRNTESLC